MFVKIFCKAFFQLNEHKQREKYLWRKKQISNPIKQNWNIKIFDTCNKESETIVLFDLSLSLSSANKNINTHSCKTFVNKNIKCCVFVISILNLISQYTIRAGEDFTDFPIQMFLKIYIVLFYKAYVALESSVWIVQQDIQTIISVPI